MNLIPQVAASGLFALVLGLAAVQAPPEPQPGGAGDAEAARQEAANRDARREEMRREVDEAARAIGAFSKAESDQALKRARSALEAMDKRIEDARLDWEREAARMSADARERRGRAMAELRAQRAEVAERYRALQGASSATWERVREQFLASYRSLADEVRRLSNADSSDGAPSTGEKSEPPAEPEESGKKDD
ncbi:hypothetical protein [Pseudoxanthomonas sacheonensis]|uniref:hypothetical protein n=1 Tax=Pseudoxanthomonas sacheonensis TaxID=443615 RepID=UPI0013D72E58|nr:hypothetical protein [Pseudoxanthomonas sacheonensis]KAF1710746.1 hypothetical protein CSC73_03980 [Pseudoxanthomonas sacheonensis]